MAKDATFRISYFIKGDNRSIKELAKDAESLKEVFQKTFAEASKFNGRTVNFAAISVGIGQAQAALQSMMGAMKELTDAYTVQKTAETQLETVMRQRMNATAQDIQSMKDLAAEQQKLGVVGDEVQLSGMQQIATFVNQKETLSTLLPAMNNLLVQQKGLNATNQDAVTVANLMGKAMQGQTSALRRVGITFSDAQEKVLKYGTESERAAILAQVITDNVGDMNAELARTDAGKQKQLSNTLGDIKEKLGALFMGAQPFLTIANTTILALTNVMKLVTGIKAATASLAAYNLRGMWTATWTKLFGASASQATRILATLRNTFVSASNAVRTFCLAIRAALVSTGVGVAIWGLCEAISWLCSSSDKAADALDDLTTAEGRAKRAAEDLKHAKEEEARVLADSEANLQVYISKLKAFNGSKAQEKKLVEELNGAYGDTMGYFSSVADWYEALTKNSKTYCKQLVIEAKMRKLADQIAESKSQRADMAANPKKYVKTTERRVATGNFSSKKVVSYSKKDVANLQQEIFDKRDLEKKWEKELEDLAKELADIKMPVIGSPDRPTLSPSPTTTEQHIASYHKEISCIQDIRDNMEVLEKEKLTADEERVAQINQELAKLRELLALWEKLGGSPEVEPRINPESIEEASKALEYYRKQLREATTEQARLSAQAKIEHFEGALDKMTPKKKEEKKDEGKVLIADPKSIAEVNNNLEYYREQLEKATTAQDRLTAKKNIKALEKLRDAYEGVGERASALSIGKGAWNGIKNVKSGLDSMVKSLKNANNWWEVISGTIDGFFSLMEGISAIVEVIKLFTVATEGQAAAETAKTVATAASTTATGLEGEMAIDAAIAKIPAIAANKALAASYTEVAAAAYFAAHAEIPFAGFGIAAGFASAAAAVVQAIGAMPFANGGIVSGPTLGLIGEYAGASNNPEVVAPLDKLRDLIQPQYSAMPPGKVEFKIKRGELVGILNYANNFNSRT